MRPGVDLPLCADTLQRRYVINGTVIPRSSTAGDLELISTIDGNRCAQEHYTVATNLARYEWCTGQGRGNCHRSLVSRAGQPDWAGTVTPRQSAGAVTFRWPRHPAPDRRDQPSHEPPPQRQTFQEISATAARSRQQSVDFFVECRPIMRVPQPASILSVPRTATRPPRARRAHESVLPRDATRCATPKPGCDRPVPPRIDLRPVSQDQARTA